MPLLFQFVVGFAVRAVVSAVGTSVTRAAFIRAGASDLGFRTTLAANLTFDRIILRSLRSLKPQRRDARDPWDQAALLASMERIREIAATHYMQGPYPERLRRQTGDSIRSLQVELRLPDSAALGTDSEHLDHYETRDYNLWRGREWLEPAIDHYMREAEDDWASRWEAAS